MSDQPSWLVAEPYTDTDHGVVKSGKEAQVNLVERVGNHGRSCLIARKRYLPRHVTQKGQLEAMGVQRSSAFRHDVQYREGRQFRKSRDRRAIERMSTYGKHLLLPSREFCRISVDKRVWRHPDQIKKLSGPLALPVTRPVLEHRDRRDVLRHG